MNILDSKLYNTANTIVDFIILNLLWFVMCLPIITIFPATSALFGVVRKWHMKKEPPIIRTFFQLFKENFVSSALISVIWALVASALYLDFILAEKYLLAKLLLIILVSVFSITTIYLFPVMVNYQNKPLRIIKNAFYLALLKPMQLVFSFIVLYGSYILLSIYPFLILFMTSLIAYLLYKICSSTFKKAEKLQMNT